MYSLRAWWYSRLRCTASITFIEINWCSNGPSSLFTLTSNVCKNYSIGVQVSGKAILIIIPRCVDRRLTFTVRVFVYPPDFQRSNFLRGSESFMRHFKRGPYRLDAHDSPGPDFATDN